MAQNVEMEKLKRFDVVADDSDHYYLISNRPKKNCENCFSNNGANGFHKKIMQEWKILDQHLPESILVRVYERRIDLLRAVIVGTADTPYHDGLFFFDLAFPPDYPNRPPLVYYRSYGLRLNPNLYANGRVCLSLLNTWSGKKNEKWNPSGSTILQVLVSIQGLVLNEKPYFNEPGVGGWTSRALLEKNCRAYNEDVFVLSCKTIVYLVRSPPKNFEGFVAEHFRKRAHLILRAWKAYKNGCIKVGYYRDDGFGSSSSSSSSSTSSSSAHSTIKVSAKFKASMEKLYPELILSFNRIGASLGSFVEQIEAENDTVSLKQAPQVIKRRKLGIRRMIMEKITKILGLKMGEQSKAKP